MKSSKVTHHAGYDGTSFSTVEDEIETLRTQAALGGQVPVGTVLDYAGAAAPTYWLLCYGQSLVRADYAALFTAIGTTFGAADADHFTLPDCRGRVVAGQDDMGGSSANRLTGVTGSVDGDTFGAAGGAETHTLTEAQLASHTHTGTTGNENANHQHTGDGALNTSSVVNNLGTGAGTVVTSMANNTTGSQNANHQHTFTSDAAGSGSAHNNVQPTIILNKIIYAGV
jgi:microcystin-dependent protein